MNIIKILSISLILGLPFITMYSQQNGGLKIDTTKRYIFNNNSTKYYLKNESSENNRIQFHAKNNGDIFDFKTNNSFRTIDNMICIKPKGNYPMTIYRPDSIHRYSLLIKKP